MKKLLIILFVFSLSDLVVAQKNTSGDNKPVIVKTDPNWNKNDNDNTQPAAVTVDGITYIAKSDGILFTLPKASNSVKLFALTGEVVWSGDLVQGRFFIPTRPGIYFLRINNKSYKVVCK